MTLNRKSQGQGHRERSQFRRSHQGLFPCKVSSLYWLMLPRTNLNVEVNQNVDRQTDGQTDRQTDRRTSSIHKPELLCNPAKKDGRNGAWLTSPLKLLNGVKRNLTGSKISTSSTKLCFSVWWVNKNYRPGRSVKKVAHCTQEHDMWPFGPLVYVFI